MPLNLGAYSSNKSLPRKSDVDSKAPDVTLVTTYAGTSLSPADNNIYDLTLTSALDVAVTANACPRYSAIVRLTISTGGSASITAATGASCVGDDISTAAAGETWEISVWRGVAIVRNVTGE